MGKGKVAKGEVGKGEVEKGKGEVGKGEVAKGKGEVAKEVEVAPLALRDTADLMMMRPSINEF